MSTLTREPMTNVDAAWLGMDRPTNLMIINGLMLFEQPIPPERIRHLLDVRLKQKYARFRQRVVASGSPSRYYWETDPHFNLRYHLRHFALPAPGDEATLQALIGELMSDPLDRNRPLWRWYLIDNFQGGCALFGRIHHCIADGVALMHVLLSLTDHSPDPLPVETLDEAPEASPSLNLVVYPWRIARGFVRRGVRTFLSLLPEDGGLTPEGLIKAAQSAGLLSAASAAILAKLLVMSSDRPSTYRGELSGIRRVTWSAPVPLAKIKEIGRATGATINDVLVAAVAGALRHDMQERGDDISLGDLRAMVPINLRRPDEKFHLGNEFSLLYLALPVSLEERHARLAAVHQRMDLLKHSPEPFVVYQVLSLLGMLPGEVAHQAVDWFAGKASCVLTNVPGPRQTIYLAGSPLARMLFWVPHSGDISMGISIFSYAGAVTLGIDVDEALVPNPDRLIHHYHAELDALAELASGLTETSMQPLP